MGTPRPTQYQRRKGLVKLILSTPLLRQFPESPEDLEEQMPRTPFHLRTPPKYNIAASFNDLTMQTKKKDLDHAMSEALPSSSANRPVRSTRTIQSYHGQAMAGNELEKHLIAFANHIDSNGDVPDVCNRVPFALPKPPQSKRRSRKRVTSDGENTSDVEDEEYVEVVRTPKPANLRPFSVNHSVRGNSFKQSNDEDPFMMPGRPASEKQSRKRVHPDDEDDEGDNIVVVKRHKPLHDSNTTGRSHKSGTVKAQPSHFTPPNAREPPDAVPLFVPKYEQPYEAQHDWKPDHKKKSPNCGNRSMGEYKAPLDFMSPPATPRGSSVASTASKTSQGYTITFIPLYASGGQELDKQLRELVKKYNLSSAFGLTGLGQDILEEFKTSDIITYEVFLKLQDICLSGKEGVVLPRCPLDMWLQERTAHYVSELQRRQPRAIKTEVIVLD